VLVRLSGAPRVLLVVGNEEEFEVMFAKSTLIMLSFWKRRSA
jgi:hypothetical protein